MSEQIREQVSAFLDGELPNSETELLLKRLTRDAELRESFGRYALIGESLRGATHGHLTKGFPARVNRAIDGEPSIALPAAAKSGLSRRWRSFAGVAVAAGVAAIAVVSYQQRANGPGLRVADAREAVPTLVAQSGGVSLSGPAKPTAAISYTVPATVPEAPVVMPAARLTNYVFAHSKYSSVMGQNDVLNDLLSEADAQEPHATEASRDSRTAP